MKRNKKSKGLIYEVKKNKTLFLMIMPAALIVFLFSYVPMTGIVLAFKDYHFNQGIFGSPFTGLENFRFFFISGTGFRITRNTIIYNLINIVTSHGLAIVLAVLFSEMSGKLFKKVSQSVVFIPYFISWIIVGAFAYNLFDYDKGILNRVLNAVGMEPINVYGMEWIWLIIIAVFNAWKWAGYNSIIYTAAIVGVDESIYEAAKMDGANIFQKIFHITIPSIKNTIVIMFLLNLGHILRGDFQMFYQLIGNNGQLFNATDVIDTFVFRSLVDNSNIGMTSAATFYQSFFCFVIIVTVNWIAKKIDEDYALF